MHWASAVESGPSFKQAFPKAARLVSASLAGAWADIAFVFVSSAYRRELIALWPQFRKALHARHVIGCTASGVIGGAFEVENEPALSITAGVLPGVQVHPFLLDGKDLPSPDAGPAAWRKAVRDPAGASPTFFLVSEPFSAEPVRLLEGLDFAYPGSVKVGGLASGGTQAGEALLILDEKIVNRGSAGLAVSGEVLVDAVVAQGCRPIGETLTVTEAHDNLLIGVNGESPMGYMVSLFDRLPERDRDLLQTSLLMGVSMEAGRENPGLGDFLIRNIIGLDQKKGILALNTEIRPGQTVQFQLRDAETSDEDMRSSLDRAPGGRNGVGAAPAQAAVMFQCVGRGRRLYGEPGHDSAVVRAATGVIPVGGVFCNGEFGPIEGRSFVHGYTSVVALFRDPVEAHGGVGSVSTALSRQKKPL